MTAMTPFGCYRAYLALKAHFTTDQYDIVQYKGRVSAKKESFEKRKDRYRLEKMSTRFNDEEIVNFFVANFAATQSYSGLWDDQSEKRYIEWKKYRESFAYNFGNEVYRMFEYAAENDISKDEVFVNPDGHPLVLLAYMGKEISLDTFVVLDRLYNFVGKLDDNVVTKDMVRLSKKYSPFVRVKLDKYADIARAAGERAYSGA